MAAGEQDAHQPSRVEDVPDPDEDDLDDLDEMLDEFASTKIDPTSSTTGAAATTADTAPGHSGPGRPNQAPPAAAPSSAEDEFARELQAGMADMLRELETNPEMASEFQAMLAQLGAPGGSEEIPADAETRARSPSVGAKHGAAPTTAKPAEDNFQDTIRRTMERMKESSNSADAAASTQAATEDDMMAKLLRELQDANGGPDGDGDDTFSKMLLGMMEQLTNKEILYEPMKELDTKFPAWLEEKGDTLPEEDKSRYKKQKELVRDIVQRFERKGYSDGNPEDREFIVEKMQEMQAAGAPPPDLVGDVNAASEIMNDMDGGCAQQ